MKKKLEKKILAMSTCNITAYFLNYLILIQKKNIFKSFLKIYIPINYYG